MSLANISIVGNAVKAPEQTVFSTGKAKTTIIVAVNSPRRPGDNQTKDHADFYKVELWGPQGDLAHKHIAKGNQVGVSGRLVLDQWTDKTGRARITPVIKADQISLPPRLRLLPSGENNLAETNAQSSFGESNVGATNVDEVLNPITGTVSFDHDPFEEFKEEVFPSTIPQVNEEPIAYKPARKRAASRY